MIIAHVKVSQRTVLANRWPYLVGSQTRGVVVECLYLLKESLRRQDKVEAEV